MCRLFGFRSVLQSQVHSSLISADNALVTQSCEHPDGWGVGYYIDQAPHVIKSVQSALDDHLFKKVSGIVTSETVLAHIRKATSGGHSILNTHPFQHGRWIFAHNGNIKDFNKIGTFLRNEIASDIRHFILGESDSEVFFYLIMSELRDQTHHNLHKASLGDVIHAAQQAVQKIIRHSGPLHPTDAGPPTENFLTFILTNGEMMVAFHGGKDLHFSTHKTKCPERETCNKFAPECESSRQAGHVNHLVLSSEPLVGENVWNKMSVGQLVAVDAHMNLTSQQLSFAV